MEPWELFNRPVTKTTVMHVVAEKGEAVEAAAEEGAAETEHEREGVFLTGQSIVTFPGGSAAVTTIWLVSGVLIDGLEQNKWVGFGIAMFVGFVIFLFHEKDPKKTKSKPGQYPMYLNLLLAFINSFVLFGAAVGINKMVPGM